MTDPITSLPAAVVAAPTLPVPVGDQPQPLDGIRLAEIAARAADAAAGLAAWMDLHPAVHGQHVIERAEETLRDVAALAANDIRRLATKPTATAEETS